MILVDTAEPLEIVELLRQVTDVEVMPLNQTLRADYYFGGEDCKTRQYCRVQAGELLRDIDSQEDELRRYYMSADKTYLVIEGFITDVQLTRRHDAPVKIPSFHHHAKPSILYSYRVAPNGWLFSETAHDVSASLFYAWMLRLSEAGVVCFFTHNYIGTAKLLSAQWLNCQRPPDSHNTLNRYYIPKVDSGERDAAGHKITFREQNPFIRMLMMMSLVYKLDIGEKKATAIAKKYNSVYDLSYTSVKELSEVEGIGKVTAQKLLQAIGMEEV